MAKMHQKFFSLASTVDPLLQLSKAFNEFAEWKRKHKLKVILPFNKEVLERPRYLKKVGH